MKSATEKHNPTFWLSLVLAGSFLAAPVWVAAQGTTIHPAALGEKAVWENSNNIVGSVTVVDGPPLRFL